MYFFFVLFVYKYKYIDSKLINNSSFSTKQINATDFNITQIGANS